MRNILSGQSRKPSEETLQAIANVLDCSVRDLLDKDTGSVSLAPHVTKNSDDVIHEWFPSLFDACVHAIQYVCQFKRGSS